MGSAFKDYLTKQRAPGWLQNPYGAAWLTALGDTLDALMDRVRGAVKARMPGVAPADALIPIGAERGIERGPSETVASYRGRLQKAWTSWANAGNAFGLLTALTAAGFGGCKIEIVNGLQYSLSAGGALVVTQLPAGSWLIDALPTFWNRFVILYPYPQPALLTPVPASSSDIARQVFRIIDAWRPGNAKCVKIVFLANGGVCWGYPPGHVWGVGTWGSPATVEWDPQEE